MKIIATNTDGSFPVTWYKRNRQHIIEYGRQRKSFGALQDVAAAHEFGECVRHALECEGKLDWTDSDA